MKLFIVLMMVFTSSAFAQNQSPEKKTDTTVQEVVKEAKKDRKKKVQMCNECGKPETECSCEGHGEEE